LIVLWKETAETEGRGNDCCRVSKEGTANVGGKDDKDDCDNGDDGDIDSKEEAAEEEEYEDEDEDEDGKVDGRGTCHVN
jgi:hypothetical protein